eukprot:11034-Heterococcus_DN1.PRE.2
MPYAARAYYTADTERLAVCRHVQQALLTVQCCSVPYHQMSHQGQPLQPYDAAVPTQTVSVMKRTSVFSIKQRQTNMATLEQYAAIQHYCSMTTDIAKP